MGLQQAQNIVVPAQGGHDEVLLGTLGQGIGPPVRQRVAGREHRHHPVLRQGNPVVGHGGLVAEKGQVGGLVLQPLDDLLADALHELNLDVRVPGPNPADDLGQPVGGHAGIGGDGDAAHQQAAHLPGQLIDPVLLLEKLPHRRQQAAAVLREGDPLSIPPQQREAQLPLQGGHQLAHP